MRSRLSALSFSLCCLFACPVYAEPAGLVMDASLAGVAVIEADQIYAEQDQRVEASGDVVLQKDGQEVRGDKVIYLRMSEQISVPGQVFLSQQGNELNGRDLQYQLDTQQGSLSEVSFKLADEGGQGSAQKINIQGAKHLELEQASYSTCTADDPDWLVSSEKLDLDRERHVGVAHHAKVVFLGVPILYTPWIDFALDDQRKSGLLAPKYGRTSSGGFEFMVPYYWNIAPNYDATIVPRFMEKRGWMLNNEFRYLGQSYQGELNADALPWDKLAKQKRGHFSWQHTQSLPYDFSAYVDLNRVSDNDYFRDLAEGVNSTSLINLPQEVGLAYNTDNWQVGLRAQQFQTLQDPDALVEVPYKRLPQLTVTGQQHYGDNNLSVQAEYVDFRHDDSVNGRRLKLYPSWSYLWRDPAGYYLNPKLGLHYTHYQLGRNNTGTLNASSRTVPIMSVDSGITLERESNWFDKPYIQTLEPRAFYSYIPFREQNELPNFDSAQADFSFAQMFTERRFFGSDRIGDANQLTLALTSRVLEEETGRERLKFVVGQRYSFESPKVYLVTPDKETTRSDLLLALNGRVSDNWSLDSDMQYDPDETLVRRYNFSAQYNPDVGKVLNLSYRYIRDTLRYVDLSAQWPLSSRWRSVARWNYSLEDSQLLEGILGLEYNQQCWTARLIGQQFVTAENQQNKRVFVQLELSDLLRIGDDPLGMLKQSITGYQSVNQRAQQK